MSTEADDLTVATVDSASTVVDLVEVEAAGAALKRPTRGRSRYGVDDPLPKVMLLSDLAELLGLGSTQIWTLQRAGELDRFECKPRIGGRPRFSGKRVQQWLDGEDPEAPQSREYFRSAKRR